MCIKQHPHLSDLELADFSDAALNLPVDVLIGSDYYLIGSICRGTSGPVAVHTKLGWVLSGPSSLDRYGQCSMNLSVTQSITHVVHSETHSVEQCTLDNQLRSFWELEALEIQEEKTLFDDFASSIKFEDGRYKVALPWREIHDPLPDNHQLSVNRLQGLFAETEAGTNHP